MVPHCPLGEAQATHTVSTKAATAFALNRCDTGEQVPGLAASKHREQPPSTERGAGVALACASTAPSDLPACCCRRAERALAGGGGGGGQGRRRRALTGLHPHAAPVAGSQPPTAPPRQAHAPARSQGNPATGFMLACRCQVAKAAGGLPPFYPLALLLQPRALPPWWRHVPWRRPHCRQLQGRCIWRGAAEQPQQRGRGASAAVPGSGVGSAAAGDGERGSAHAGQAGRSSWALAGAAAWRGARPHPALPKAAAGCIPFPIPHQHTPTPSHTVTARPCLMT